MRQLPCIFRPALICLAILGLCLFGLSTFGAFRAVAEVSVEASLNPLSFPQDKAARLTITVTGTSRSADIDLPEIAHIQLRKQGTSSRLSMVNGDFSSSVSHSYLVQADQPGSYTIPAFTVSAAGESATTQPLSFTVTQVGQSAQQPSGYSTPDVKNTGEIAFIRISPTGSHYPGELVPFTIKAYFTQAYRADINSLPTLRGDGVVMAPLPDKPQQTEELVEGRMYHVLTWQTSLSGIKAGEHPISFTLDATLLIPQKRRARSSFGGSGFFDDSFFNDSALDNFFGTTEQKPIVSVSPEVVFAVLPLPTTGQPADFTGAIGDFAVQVEATPTDVEIGEPITLTTKISGTGNFDRVEAPVFPESADWKTYSPSAKFVEQGNSYTGTKIFEQAIVAKSAAVSKMPPLSFSYFDPQQKHYITQTATMPAIHIKKPAASTTAGAAPAVAPTAAAQPEPAAAPSLALRDGSLAPLHLETGSYQQYIVPLYKTRWFILLCVVVALLMPILGVLLFRRRTRARHPEIERQRQKRLLLISDLQRIEQAQAAGDSQSFLALAKTAIQNQLGLLWHIEPAALSLSDISHRLPESIELLEIFRTANAAAYGGASLSPRKMQEYIGTLKTRLEELL